mgnify:FL=1
MDARFAAKALVFLGLLLAGAGAMAAGRLAAGSGHSLAVGADGVVVAWGNDDWGQLGNGRPRA